MDLNRELSKAELDLIGKYILVQTEIRKADIGFIFGSSHSGQIFADKAYELFQQNFFSKLVITGGITKNSNNRCESHVIAEYLYRLGMKDSDMIIEDKSTNTVENVKFSMSLIEEKIGKIDSILAIGKIFASRRCLMTLKKYFPNSYNMISAINLFNIPTEEWYKSIELKKKILNEYIKIPKYIEYGHIEEL